MSRRRAIWLTAIQVSGLAPSDSVLSAPVLPRIGRQQALGEVACGRPVLGAEQGLRYRAPASAVGLAAPVVQICSRQLPARHRAWRASRAPGADHGPRGCNACQRATAMRASVPVLAGDRDMRGLVRNDRIVAELRTPPRIRASPLARSSRSSANSPASRWVSSIALAAVSGGTITRCSGCTDVGALPAGTLAQPASTSAPAQPKTRLCKGFKVYKILIYTDPRTPRQIVATHAHSCAGGPTIQALRLDIACRAPHNFHSAISLRSCRPHDATV